MKRVILFIIVVLLSFNTSCNDTLTGPGSVLGELPRDLTTSEKKIIEADQKFSYDLFRKSVARSSGENLLISPLSVSMALSMALNGADQDTYSAMKDVLKFKDTTIEEINDGFNSLTDLLVHLDSNVKMKIANSIWFRDGLPVKELFLERVKDAFGATAESVNFNDSDTIEKINDWVRVNTDGLIDKIIDEISDDDVMFLINAIYFKGDWLNRFDKKMTEEADFHLEGGNVKTVDLMSQTGRFAYHFSDEIKMIELPYGDSLFAMTVIMPSDPGKSIDLFIEEQISAGNLSKWRSALSDGSNDIQLQLPKFEIEYEKSLNDILKEMGMEIAFDEWNADFTGIADVSPQNIAIGDVMHKTVIRVDEDGSEAAAVTNVGMVVTSMPPSFRVDRPFVFIIHERESGTNLFMGKVVDP